MGKINLKAKFRKEDFDKLADEGIIERLSKIATDWDSREEKEDIEE